MKYLLIMQLIIVGSQKGGGSLDTVILDSHEQCEKVKAVFMYNMKDDRPYGRIYRKAECVELSQ